MSDKGTAMAKKLILVIEDEEDVLELVQYNLKNAGYQTLGALSGENGLRMAGGLLPRTPNAWNAWCATC